MPFYEFEYKDKHGKTKVVEQRFRMSEMPDAINVQDGGHTYVAVRIMSKTADCKYAWNYDIKTSDLPPVDYQSE